MERRILIVESGAGALTRGLREAGYACTRAPSLAQAAAAAEGGSFDLAVVDCAAREERAPELVSLLRARGRLPVLVISPPGGREGLVKLLDAGAEDYITRPFELRELVERIEVQLRRSAGAAPRGALRHRQLALDPESFNVTLCDQPVALTRQEFRMLELMLLSPPGRVFSKQDFFDCAWERGYAGVDKTVNVHICNIRKKFRAITEEQYIETIWGMGFRLV